jgi:hypothetical protein
MNGCSDWLVIKTAHSLFADGLLAGVVAEPF